MFASESMSEIPIQNYYNFSPRLGFFDKFSSVSWENIHNKVA